MRILQLSKYYPPTHGGLELVAEFFSRAARELGHEVSVISLGKESLTYEGRFQEKVLQGREDIKLSSTPLSLAYLLQVRRQLLTGTPDYIFVHLPNPFAHEIINWLRPIASEKKVKIVGVYHSDIVNQVHLRDAYNLHFTRHLKTYDSFICSSPNLQRSSEILSKLPEGKVKIIPFCVDHAALQKPVKRPANFQGKFIAIGRMVPYKGYEFLIKTFNELPYELTLVGQGPLKAQLQKLAKPNIRFVGEISEDKKFELLQSSDALIMSSINRAEAYGMTIVEAFSIGLPVIAANLDTGVSFLVRDGITGLKFPINDVGALTDRVELLKSDRALQDKLSQGCLAFFLKELGYDAFRDNLKSFFAAEL